jgi:hypothetical protein
MFEQDFTEYKFPSPSVDWRLEFSVSWRVFSCSMLLASRNVSKWSFTVNGPHSPSNRQARGLRVLVGIAFAASWRHWRTLKNTEGLSWFVDLCLNTHVILHYSTLFYTSLHYSTRFYTILHYSTLFYGACQTKKNKAPEWEDWKNAEDCK